MHHSSSAWKWVVLLSDELSPPAIIIRRFRLIFSLTTLPFSPCSQVQAAQVRRPSFVPSPFLLRYGLAALQAHPRPSTPRSQLGCQRSGNRWGPPVPGTGKPKPPSGHRLAESAPFAAGNSESRSAQARLSK